MYKSHFSKFINANPDVLHFAAHSHHYWADVTFEAQKQYWLDSAKMVDDKWEYILGNVVKEAQENIAFHCGLSHPEMIAFAPNTHEFVVRLFSCFDLNKPFRVLTTDSEFHSFSRQASRLEEKSSFEVMRVPTEPFETFSDRFITELEKNTFDLVFISKVFFNSGFHVEDIERIINKVLMGTTIVVDGYHAFFAIPQDLRKIEDRIFFLGGGYKYAMSGEGACFMYIPKGCELRPANTGWFAGFGELSEKSEGKVGYSNDAYRFWGSTFDATGIYRFNAVNKWLRDSGFSVDGFRDYVVGMQEMFLGELKHLNSKILKMENLLSSLDYTKRGNFLTFKLDNAGETAQKLKEKNVMTDYRNDRLRFGFAIYHDGEDIEKLIKILKNID